MFLRRVIRGQQIKASISRSSYLKSNILRSSITLTRFNSTQQPTKIEATSEVKIEQEVKSQSEEVANKNGLFKLPKTPGLGDSYLADYERLTKYSLIPLAIVPFYASYAGMILHPIIDTTIASIFLMYAHYGFTSLVLQYVPKDKFPRWNKASMWTLYTSSFLALCGIYELETENNGVVDIITKLWNYDERNLYVFGRN